MAKIDLSVVIPIYNEQETLQTLFSRLSSSISEAGFNNYEIIFINDGSSDISEQIIKELQLIDANITLINLSRNFGHQAALMN